MQCGFFHTPYNLPHRTARQMFDWSLKMAQVCDEAGFTDFMIGEHSTLAWRTYLARRLSSALQCP